MPTGNRRVATYLPKHIDEQLELFKKTRGIKGDSQALIVILSEFFGVTQEVAYQSSSADLELQNRVGVLEEKVSQLKHELLNDLRKELLDLRVGTLQQAKAEVKDELLSELQSESHKSSEAPGQLRLIPEELPIVSPDSLIGGELNTRQLADRLKVDRRSVERRREKADFPEWTRSKDPDSIAWQYSSANHRYFPSHQDESLSELKVGY